MKPDARREQLLLEEVGDELVVYDLERHRAHQLNRTAALVWRSCDGHKTVTDLKRVLQNELNPAADEAIVWKALDRLGKARLLREPRPRASGTAGMTRRQALGKFGQGAALAFLAPVVTSITAPTPLQAAHRSPRQEFLCGEPPCRRACDDRCKSDADCPRGNPLCRLFPCSNPNCGRCIQRRCVKAQTPFAIRLLEI